MVPLEVALIEQFRSTRGDVATTFSSISEVQKLHDRAWRQRPQARIHRYRIPDELRVLDLGLPFRRGAWLRPPFVSLAHNDRHAHSHWQVAIATKGVISDSRPLETSDTEFSRRGRCSFIRERYEEPTSRQQAASTRLQPRDAHWVRSKDVTDAKSSPRSKTTTEIDYA